MKKMDLLEIVNRARLAEYDDEMVVVALSIIIDWDNIKVVPELATELYKQHREVFQMIMEDHYRVHGIFESCGREVVDSIFNYYDLNWVDQFWTSKGYEEVPIDD